MDLEQFDRCAKTTLNYIVDYIRKLPERAVSTDVEPDYLRQLLPEEPPEHGEPYDKLLADFEKFVVPGMMQWQSPNYFAHYPCSASYPSTLAELLTAALGIFSFNWVTSPVVTDMEVVMMDWLGKLLGLPKEFLNGSEGPGGGVIKITASEATLVCLLSAKEKTVKRIKLLNPKQTEPEIKGKLVLYSSEESNSSVEKAGKLASVIVRLIPTDEEGAMDEQVLLRAIKADLKQGLFPCFAVATLGTTGTCSFDDLEKLGPICEEYGIWLHVDAAYAGALFACPEYRYLMNGVERVQSFNFNPHKMLLCHFTCAALWVKNAGDITDAFTVERSYLHHDQIDNATEYIHWQVHLGKKFNSLKVWFALRTFGVAEIRKMLRRHVALAKFFARVVALDDRFELCVQKMGLVAFRLRASNEVNEELLRRINESRVFMLSSYTFREKFLIRLIINNGVEEDIMRVWEHIKAKAEGLQICAK